MPQPIDIGFTTVDLIDNTPRSEPLSMYEGTSTQAMIAELSTVPVTILPSLRTFKVQQCTLDYRWTIVYYGWTRYAEIRTM